MYLEHWCIPFLDLRKYVCTSLVETVCCVRVTYVQKGAGATPVFGCYPNQVQYLLILYEKTGEPSHPSGWS